MCWSFTEDPALAKGWLSCIRPPTCRFGMSPEVKFCSRQLNPSINLTKYTAAPHNPIRPILIMKTLTPPRHSYQVHRLPVAALAAAALVNSTATTSQAERAASRLDLESACQAALFPKTPPCEERREYPVPGPGGNYHHCHFLHAYKDGCGQFSRSKHMLLFRVSVKIGGHPY